MIWPWIKEFHMFLHIQYCICKLSALRFPGPELSMSLQQLLHSLQWNYKAATLICRASYYLENAMIYLLDPIVANKLWESHDETSYWNGNMVMTFKKKKRRKKHSSQMKTSGRLLWEYIRCQNVFFFTSTSCKDSCLSVGGINSLWRQQTLPCCESFLV